MPTEKRSSNTDSKIQPLAQHPEGRRERFQKWVLATKHPVLGYLDGTWLARGDDREGYADKYVQGLWVAFEEFAQPAPQPHPDPLAWMVGTAFWWTKEEAERDAAATGLQAVPIGPMASQCGEAVWFMTEGGLSVLHAKAKAMSDQQGLDTSSYRVPLYTHADTAEVKRLREELDLIKISFDSNFDAAQEAKAERDTLRAEVERLRAELDNSYTVAEHERLVAKGQEINVSCIRSLRAQLAEAQALLREIHDGSLSGFARYSKIEEFLSASAEPSALPDPLGCSACAHTECGRFDGPRQVECRAMADNACARPGASS